MLIGRDHELDAVRGCLERHEPVAVIGEAGIGKTAVIRAAARALPRAYEGGGISSLSWLPYLAVTRAFGAPPRPGDHAAVALDIVEHTGKAALILDDLHWADPDTLALVPLLAGRIALVVAIRRGDPGADRALAVLKGSEARLVDVPPLRGDDAVAVVRIVRPGIAAAEADDIVERAGGNPLFLEELARQGDSSPTLHLALRAGFQRCSPAARDAMARLGLLGRPAGRRLLGAGVDELLAAALVVRAGAEYAPRHQLLGEAAADELSPPKRRRLHSLLARSLNEPGEAARHHVAAGEIALASARALEAAERATRPGERASHLLIAAQAVEGEEAAVLHVRAASALVEAGDFARAGDIAGAIRTASPAVASAAGLELARARWSCGDPAGAMEAVNGAIGAAMTPTVEVGLGMERVRLALYEFRTAEGATLARETYQLALRHGVETIRAQLVLGWALAFGESPGEGLAHLQTVRQRARAAAQYDLELDTVALIAGAAFNCRDLTLAAAVLPEAIDRARELRLRGRECELRWYRARMDAFSFGRYADALRDFEELFADRALGHAARYQLAADFAVALSDVGRDADARAVLEQPPQAASTVWDDAIAAWARTDIAWTAGRPHDALPVAEACLVPDRSHTALALVAANRDWCLLDLGRPPGPRHEGRADDVTAIALTESAALARLAEGAARDAQRLFAQAAGEWTGFVLRWELRCLWGAGEAALRAGDRASARDLLRSVEWRAHEHRLEPLARRARRSLRRAGARPDTRVGRGSLTPRETDVIRLVGAGLTSRQIGARLGVAPSTVETAVRSVVRKLGAKTRAEAAARASTLA